MRFRSVFIIAALALAPPADRAQAQQAWVIDGASDDEVSILGEVKDILRLDDGRTIVLDVQQGLVKVFGVEGDHLTTVSYDGDGPGEARNAVALVEFPAGRVSVVQARPPKLAMLGLDGAEAGDCKLNMPDDLGYVSAVDAASNGRALILKLYVESIEDGATAEVLKLVRWENVESSPVVLAERKETMESRGGMFLEFDSLDELSRWDIDESGRLVIAPYFEAFEVQVWNVDGSLSRVDRHPSYERVRKSEARYESILGQYERMSRFVPNCKGVSVSEFERDIQKLAAANDGGYLALSSAALFPDEPENSLSVTRWAADGKRLPDVIIDVSLRHTCDMFWIAGDCVYVLWGGKSAIRAARRGDPVGDAIVGEDACAAPERVADMTLECYPLFNAP